MGQSKKIKTEHSGAKNGGGHFGTREEAKQISKKLRRENEKSEIKDYLDEAETGPIHIKKESRESFFLLAEKDFLELKNEITSLQRRIHSMNDIIKGNVSEYEGPEKRLERFQGKDSSNT